MTDAELWDALEGLHAYDVGCIDSGIRDEALRARAKATLHGRRDGLKWLAERVREAFLSPKAIEIGYGLRDVDEFVDWLRDEMGYDV